ncbi:regulatory protein [Mycobacterium tuberculosis]|nr:regulatory protein [Mycobacterium tuberculosis]
MAVEEMVRRRRGSAGSTRVPCGPTGGLAVRGLEPHGGGFALLGRAAEVADLSGQVDRLRDGQGGVLLIEGVPGIGKSRLAHEARAIAEASGIRVLTGTGEHDRQDVPFGALLQALVSDGRPVVETGVLRTLSESAEQGFWLFRAVRDQLARAAADRPLLIAIDDLQWCDAGTVLALRTLAAGLPAHPILWLATVRTGSSGADVRATVGDLADAGARRMSLGPLPEDAVAAMARDLLDAEPGRDLLSLLQQAGGQPLMVVEIVRGLLGEGAVTWTDAVAHLSGRHVPIHRYGSARHVLDHLSPLTRGVLRIASVLGRDLDPVRLAELSEHTVLEVVAALEEAIDADLVRMDPLTFRHDIVREAIRETLPVPLRRALRRAVADLTLQRAELPTASR